MSKTPIETLIEELEIMAAHHLGDCAMVCNAILERAKELNDNQ